MSTDLDAFLGSVDSKKDEVVDKLNRLAGAFKKAKGKGSLGVGRHFSAPEVIPTGIPDLDQNVLAIGGLARGRVIEIAGETNAGKSTLAWNICREAIAQGLAVVVCENEGTFTHEYAEAIGMDPDSYHLFKGYNLGGPEFLEEVMRLAEIGYDLIIVDSLFGIEGKAAADARLTEMKMNTKQSGPMLVANFAKLWKNGWKPLTTLVKKSIFKGVDSGATLVLITHLKDRFDGYGKGTTGSVDITFLYSQRVWIERLGMSDDVDDDGNPIYTRVRVICRKSKLSPGGRYVTMAIDNRNGRFETDGKIYADAAEKKKIIEKKGSWYRVHPDLVLEGVFSVMKADMKWQGRKAFVQYCRDNELLDSILRFGNARRKKIDDKS